MIFVLVVQEKNLKSVAEDNMKIILGSQSKGRQKMLKEMGIKFEAMSADIDERKIRFEDPGELTLALARAKAEALKPKVIESVILITADGVVVCNGQILEKPENEAEARKFLKGYDNFPAEVVTAIVATNTKTGGSAEGTDISKVYFTKFSEEDIDELIKTGDVFRWAGAFNVEGPIWESHLIKIEGTRDGAIGLPKNLTAKLMRKVAE